MTAKSLYISLIYSITLISSSHRVQCMGSCSAGRGWWWCWWQAVVGSAWVVAVLVAAAACSTVVVLVAGSGAPRSSKKAQNRVTKGNVSQS